MAFGINPGQITDGPGADSYRQGVLASYNLPAGQQIFPGQVLTRNYLSVAGRNDQYPAFSQTDFGVLATSSSSGWPIGAVAKSNSSAQLQNTNTTASQVARLLLYRQGIVPVRCGAINGGTAVTIGSYLSFTSAIGASTNDFPTAGASYTPGASIGYVVGQQIQTVTTSAITTSGSQTVSVANTNGITTSAPLTFDYGQGVQETVTPTAVTAQVKAYGTISPVVVSAAAGTVITVTINGVSTTYTTVSGDTTAATLAGHIATAINQSQIVYGTGAVVANAQVSGNVVYVTALSGGTPGNSITLASSSSSTGNYTVSVSGATLANGTYGTVTATFSNAHASGAVIVGQNVISGGSIIPVPAATGGVNIDTVLCNLAFIGY